MNHRPLKLINRFIYLLFAGVLSSGCNERDTSYFPLKKGLEWRYQIQKTTMGGTEKQKRYISSIEPRVINNEITHIQRSLTGTLLLYRKTDAGVERVGYLVANGVSEELIEDTHLMMPVKTETGIEWESLALTQILNKKGVPVDTLGFQIMVKIPVKNRIESTDAVIKVPAGRFDNCVEIYTSGFAFHSGSPFNTRTLIEIKQTKWYAPGVGLVKSTLVETSTSDAYARGEVIVELESYSEP